MNDSASRGKLSEQHHQMLTVESSISPEVVEQRGYWTATDEDQLKNLGFAKSQRRVPALVVPMYSPTGELITHQIRPDHPRRDTSRKKDENGEYPTIKYETPAGAGVHLDVHPSMREAIKDPSIQMWITEGGKTADAMTSRGEVVICLAGVWCFNAEEWDDIPLLRRSVIIAFDSDAVTKTHVQHAMRRLGTFLAIRGANVWIALLPSGDEGEKMGMDDLLARGTTADELRGLATPQTMPYIETGERYIREITADAVGILHALNNPPRYFMFGTELVRLRGDGTEVLTPDALSGVLDRSANFIKSTNKGPKPSSPPTKVVKDILSLDELPFPELKGVVRSPVFTATGELLQEDGYHRPSGLLLHRNGLGEVRADMSTDEAMSWLSGELLTDFPFVDDGARAHALAMILQPFARQLVSGPTPLFLLDAPVRGSGKGLLVECVSLIATGGPASMMQPGENVEMEKRISAALLEGTQMLTLDNVNSLYLSALAAALTSEIWKGRRLGYSEMISMRNTCLWSATGNNVSLSSEIARRTMPVRLDPETENPELRDDFRHTNLKRYAKDHRAELVSAALSLIQQWLDAGAPRSQETVGSFEGWCETLGGILNVAGVPGLLSGREYLEGEDDDSAEWASLVIAWWGRFGGNAVTAADVLDVAKDHHLLLDMFASRGQRAAQQRFGHELGKKRDSHISGYVIRSAGRDSKRGNRAYRLEKKGNGGGDNDSDSSPTGVFNQNTGVSEPKHPSQNALDTGHTGVSGVSGVLVEPSSNNGLKAELGGGPDATGSEAAGGLLPSDAVAKDDADGGTIRPDPGLSENDNEPDREKTPETPETPARPIDKANMGGCFGSEAPQNTDQNTRKRLTEEESRRVQKLIEEGMLPEFAREEVLGQRGHDTDASDPDPRQTRIEDALAEEEDIVEDEPF